MAEWFFKRIFWVLVGGCFLIPQNIWGQGTLIIPFGGVKEMGPAHSPTPLPYEKNYIMLPMTSGNVIRSDGGQQIIVQKPVPLHPRRKTVIPLDQIQGQVSPTPVVPRGFNGGNVTHYSSSVSYSGSSVSPAPVYTHNPTMSQGNSVSPVQPSPTPTYAVPEMTTVSPSTESLPPPTSPPTEHPSILVPSEATTETPLPSPTEDISSSVSTEIVPETTVIPETISSVESIPDSHFSGENETEMPAENESTISTEPSESPAETDPYVPMHFSPLPHPEEYRSPSSAPSPLEESPASMETTSTSDGETPKIPETPSVSSEKPALETWPRETPSPAERPTHKRAENSIYNTPAISTYRENGEILTRRANIMDYYQNVTPIQVPKPGGSTRMGGALIPPASNEAPLPNALPGGKPASNSITPGTTQTGRKV